MLKIILLLAFLPIRFYGQDNNRINFTFLVNGLVLGYPVQPKLYSISKEGKTEFYDINIIPGDILINQGDLKKIAIAEDSVFVSFQHDTFKKQTQESHLYTIRIYKKWFTYSWLVIKIYDLNKKENRKIIPTHPGDQYEYDYDTPDGSAILIRRK
jgi:hypothetical protein